MFRGAQKGAYEVVFGYPTTAYIDYCMRRLEYLKNAFQVNLVAVFHGAKIPGICKIHEARRKKRDQFKFLEQGAVVTEEMIRNVVQRVKMIGIDFVVAPCEADEL